MNIRWTAEAVSNLENICLYISEDNPAAALKTVNTIYERIEELVVFPNGIMGGTKVFVRQSSFHVSYIVASNILRAW